MSKIYVGIDIGLKGGIVVLKNSKIVFKHTIPLLGSEVDKQKLCAIFSMLKNLPINHEEIHVVYENISALFGLNKQAAMNLAKQAGYIEMLCCVFKLPHSHVSPRKWQAFMFKDVKIESKSVTIKNGDGTKESKTKTDTKKTALKLVRKLIPCEDFIATPRSRKPHDGLIDAYLLAEYARRNNI